MHKKSSCLQKGKVNTSLPKWRKFMRSSYILTVEGPEGALDRLFLNCNARQATKCFNALAFALPTNKMGYKRLILSHKMGSRYTVINSASFMECK